MKQSVLGIVLLAWTVGASAQTEFPKSMSGFGLNYETVDDSQIASLHYTKAFTIRSSKVSSGSLMKKMFRNLELFFNVNLNDVSLHRDQPDEYDFMSMETSFGLAIQRPIYLYSEAGFNTFEVLDQLLDKNSLEMTDYFYAFGLGIKKQRFLIKGYAKYRNFEELDLPEESEWFYGLSTTLYF
jgi:hypothetical protein